MLCLIFSLVSDLHEIMYKESFKSRRSVGSKKHGEPSSATLAVAFQDHLLRDLSFECFSKPNNCTVNLKNKGKERERIQSLKKIKPTVDTGLCRKKNVKPKKTNVEQQEFVLDPRPKPATLAQKLGIVPLAPDQKQLLTEDEWKDLKKVSIKRETFINPCAICQDSFRLEDQVLLSCSHVFHRACLQAFERFTGRKTCPMCRHENYQSRVVFDGSNFYKIKSAIKIQSYWRGYVVRRWYNHLRETVPPSDPRLRRKFYESKLSQITDRFVTMTSSDTVDRFLSDIDRSVVESRRIFRHWEINGLNQLSEKDWIEIENRAIERTIGECSICLQDFQVSLQERSDDKSTKTKTHNSHQHTNGGAVLLSCSHVFHQPCLEALEQFAAKLPEFQTDRRLEGGSGHPGGNFIFKCPICRSYYKKLPITIK